MKTDQGDIIGILNFLMACVNFRKTMFDMPNCNNCGAAEGCDYLPDWGQPVRWNCPHWKERGE